MDGDTVDCLKTVLVCCNFVFMVGGLILVSVGVWVMMDDQAFLELVSSNLTLQYIVYLVVGAGVLTFLISFCGCWGTVQNSKCLLKMFVNVLVVLLVAEIVILVMIFAFQGILESTLRNYFLAAIADYGGETTVTMALDYIQNVFACCGFTDGNDYKGSPHATAAGTAQPWPMSCCTVVPSGSSFVDQSSCLNSATINEDTSNAKTGCYESLRNLVMSYATWILLTVPVLMTMQLLAIIFGCIVARSVDERQYH